MKKIPTLFKREFDDKHCIKNTLPIVTEGMEWVLEGEGYATEKIDGACCALINGTFYKRYDAKKGKIAPEGAIPCCEPDPITGHHPHWITVNINNPEDKWFVNAFIETAKKYEEKYYINDNGTLNFIDNTPIKGEITYEAIGKHFNNNPYNLESDILILHGSKVFNDVERSYEGIKNYLENNFIEGIVFWKQGIPMCKIKRSDFGFEWNKKIK